LVKFTQTVCGLETVLLT